MDIFAANKHAVVTASVTTINTTIDAGSSNNGSIMLSNTSDTPLTIKINIEDCEVLRGVPRCSIIEDATSANASTWFTLKNISPITLSPWSKHTIEYTVTPPKDSEPWKRFVTIFFDTDNGIRTRKNKTAFAINIPGEMSTRLSIGNIQLDHTNHQWNNALNIRVPIKNHGTVRTIPQGTLTLYINGNKQKVILNQQKNVLLPNEKREFNVIWNRNIKNHQKLKKHWYEDVVYMSGSLDIQIQADIQYEWRLDTIYSQQSNTNTHIPITIEKKNINKHRILGVLVSIILLSFIAIWYIKKPKKHNTLQDEISVLEKALKGIKK